jgi:hypothetical protein
VSRNIVGLVIDNHMSRSFLKPKIDLPADHYIANSEHEIELMLHPFGFPRPAS